MARLTDWPPCSQCAGAAIADDRCVAHLPPDALAVQVEEAIQRGTMLDARGASVTPELLASLVGSGPDDRPVMPAVDFSESRFADGVDFAGARFGGEAKFFDVRFDGAARFTGARFAGRAGFAAAEFVGGADFSIAEFCAAALFSEARFAGRADFSGGRFLGDATFFRTRFGGETYFNATTLERDAVFAGARFGGTTVFGPARFSRSADFHEAVFEQRIQLGPFVIAGGLNLDRVSFERDARLDVAARELSCRRTRFGGRADLNVRWADATLDEATFVAPSRLAGVPPFEIVSESELESAFGDRDGGRPRLLSVRQADVRDLVLANIDLRACRFFGAHGLSLLSFEADCEFAQPPPGRRHTRRRTLAEEHDWRASVAPEQGWLPPECGAGEEPSAALDPAQVAPLYRQLRKALEDSKDEPGAGDFYYGEMEMRRHGTADRSERAILTLYWLVSGYGLRAARALGWLAAAIIAGALLLDWFGFRPDRAFGRSLLFAVESSISLLRAPEVRLTASGEVVQIALRLLGPLFVGLALLALRGRVKR
jgi:hypothetical protein